MKHTHRKQSLVTSQLEEGGDSHDTEPHKSSWRKWRGGITRALVWVGGRAKNTCVHTVTSRGLAGGDLWHSLRAVIQNDNSS